MGRTQAGPLRYSELARMFMPLIRAVRLYHRYEVFGIDHIPEQGAALLVVTHSFATYDIMLLGSEIFIERNRRIRPLGDRLIFKTPGVGEIAAIFGAVEGSMENAQYLVEKGHLLTVAPGGMREALRPSTRRYELDWEKRFGFARLAIEAQMPVILAACPKADDLYTLYDNPVTERLYETFRIPVPILRGLGLSLIPRPVHLIHELSAPIIPPVADNSPPSKQQTETFQRELVEEMEILMQSALSR